MFHFSLFLSAKTCKALILALKLTRISRYCGNPVSISSAQVFISVFDFDSYDVLTSFNSDSNYSNKSKLLTDLQIWRLFTYAGSFLPWWRLHSTLQRNCRNRGRHNPVDSADTGQWLDHSSQVWIGPGCHYNHRAGRNSLAQMAGRNIHWNI